MADVDLGAGEPTISDEADVIERLRQLFVSGLNVRVPSDDTDLLGSGLLDSLGLVELLFQVEQTFGVTLELEELEVDHFRSLRTIGATLTAQRRAALGQLPPVPG